MRKIGLSEDLRNEMVTVVINNILSAQLTNKSNTMKPTALQICLFVIFALPCLVIGLSVTGMIIKHPSPFRTIETQENESYYVDQYDSIYKIQQKRFKD